MQLAMITMLPFYFCIFLGTKEMHAVVNCPLVN